MIRTSDFINWKRFLEEENEHLILILDFDIDAGFSFTNAVAQMKMHKTCSTVSLDSSLRIPSKILRFNNLILSNALTLHSVKIESHHFQKIETTERYTLSATFSPCSVNYKVINSELSQRIDKCGNCSEENIIRLYMVDYFQTFANIVKNNILSFIELSSSFTKFVNGSYNLYLSEDGRPYRIVQESEVKETAWHNPVHPLLLRASAVQKSYEMLLRIPDNIKTYLVKGAHYKFLGFYDESFIIKLLKQYLKVTPFHPFLLKMYSIAIIKN